MIDKGSDASHRSSTLRKRLLSGLGVGGFGLLVVSLGLVVHRCTRWDGASRPAGVLSDGAVQGDPARHQNNPRGLSTAAVHHPVVDAGRLPEAVASAVLPLSGAAICGWLLLQPVTGSIADIAASIFGLFYLGFLPSHWLSLRGLENGLALTLSACLMIVATDIGSWAVGRRYGRRPLSPISPAKPSKAPSVDSSRRWWWD